MAFIELGRGTGRGEGWSRPSGGWAGEGAFVDEVDPRRVDSGGELIYRSAVGMDWTNPIAEKEKNVCFWNRGSRQRTGEKGRDRKKRESSWAAEKARSEGTTWS